MADGNRVQCTNCGTAIYNVVDKAGNRAPIVCQIVVGQPDDTGEPVNWSTAVVPEFIRQMGLQAVPRISLCVNCVSKILKLPSVPANEEHLQQQVDESGVPVQHRLYNELPASVSRLDRERLAMRPALKSLAGLELTEAIDVPPEAEHFTVVQDVKAKAQVRLEKFRAFKAEQGKPKVRGDVTPPMALPPAVA